MQTGIFTGSVRRGRISRFLRVRDVEGSAALPYAIFGGEVRSFKVDYDDPMTFSGDILRLENDGRVYAVFSDEFEADRYRRNFAGCALTSLGGYMNAYCLGRAW